MITIATVCLPLLNSYVILLIQLCCPLLGRCISYCYKYRFLWYTCPLAHGEIISHVCGQMIKNCRSLTILEHKFQIFKCCFQWYNYVHNYLKGLLLGVTNTIFSQILVSWKILRSIPLVCGQMVKDCRSMIIPGYALKALFSRESSTLCCFI